MTKKTLIPFASLALCIGSSFAAPPGGGSTSGPTLVKEVAKPALSAIAAKCDISLTNQFNGSCTAMTVPTGQILVIEHLSASCSFNQSATVDVLALNVRTTVAAGPSSYVDIEVPMAKQAAGNGYAYWKGSQMVRGYADPGTNVQPYALRTTGTVASGYCAVQIVGHTVQAQ